MLTKQQLRAAARHARELAMECVNGTAPEFGAYDYCDCANGEVATRAGIEVGWAYMRPTRGDGILIESAGGKAGWLVTHAMFTEERADGISRHDCAVFPLLALADELENAARSAAPKGLLEEGEGK